MAAAEHPVVGRDDELRSIGDALDAARGPAILLLEGEPGIGKTTLWLEAVRAARERSWRVLTSRPSPAEAGLALAGLADLVGPEIAVVLPVLPGPQRAALEAALLLSDASATPPDPRTIAVAFLSALRVLARERPVLVAVDDVNWLDGPSARVLAFALRRLRTERIVAAFTHRRGASDDQPLHEELDRAIREGRSDRLSVGPLSLGALHALLRDRIALTLPRPLLQQVHAASTGNPLIALEIGEAIRRRGGPLDPHGALPVPTAVGELIAERLAVLPDRTIDAVLVAAALREPTLASCAAALGADDLWQRLRPAIEVRILEVEGDRLRFSHPLFAAAAYSRVDPERRRSTHRRLARTAPTLEERARHLALATDVPEETVAQALEDAAASAAARGATDAGAELLEMAAGATPVDRTEDATRRRIAAASQHLHSGNGVRARELLERAMVELPPGRLRARAAASLAWTTDDWTEVERLCLQAIEEAGDDDAIASAAHYYLTFSYLIVGSVDRAVEHGRAALELAERVGEEEVVAMRLGAVILVDTLAGRPVADDVATRALDLEGRHPEMPTWYPPTVTCGLRALYARRMDEARRLLAAAERRVIERGDELMLGGVRLHQAELEDRAGNWDAARRYAQEALDLAQRTATAAREGAVLYEVARVAAQLGRVEEAREAATRGHELAARAGQDSLWDIQCLAVLGLLELSIGDAAAADHYLRPLPDRLAGHGVGEPSFCPALPDAVWALVLIGDLDLARAFTDRLEAQARSVDSSWARALAARCRGMVASGSGDLEEAITQLARSLDEPLPEPFERARTLLALGAAQRRAKRRREARATLGEALSIFERLGASLWAEKARVELGRIGGRVPQGRLTATERQVADLVGRGLSNREVAAHLVVSERAVEANLTRIYDKLGLRSRTELARRYATGEMDSPPA